MAKLGHLIRNARTVFATPGMPGAYARWTVARALGRQGPGLKLDNGGTLFLWNDFSDFWWGRQLVLLDKADANLMRRIVAEAGGRPTTALDVGAHVGIFALNMASAGFSAIHAFEANPRTFGRCAQHVAANGAAGKVRMMCAAVGESYGVATFMIGYGSGTDHVATSADDATQRGQTAIGVITIPLDEYCARQGIERVDLLKIDVEGYESWVIRGMSRMLRERRVGTIIMEICPALQDRAGTSVAALAELIGSHGYEVRSLEENGTPGRVLTARELDDARRADPPFINVLCVPAPGA